MTRLVKFKEFIQNYWDNLHNGMSIDDVSTTTREFIKTNEGALDGIAGKTVLT